jgi:MtfA peptidase
MIVTPEANQVNRRQALLAAALVAGGAGLLGWLSPPLWLLFGLSPFMYWWVRRQCLRRLAVMQRPFPDSWEQILRTTWRSSRRSTRRERRVPAAGTGLSRRGSDHRHSHGGRRHHSDVGGGERGDPHLRVPRWEYHRLREVLIYPDAFDDAYRSRGGSDETILGMVGLHHLSGVMILSKRRSWQGSPINRQAQCGGT